MVLARRDPGLERPREHDPGHDEGSDTDRDVEGEHGVEVSVEQ